MEQRHRTTLTTARLHLFYAMIKKECKTSLMRIPERRPVYAINAKVFNSDSNLTGPIINRSASEGVCSCEGISDAHCGIYSLFYAHSRVHSTAVFAPRLSPTSTHVPILLVRVHTNILHATTGVSETVVRCSDAFVARRRFQEQDYAYLAVDAFTFVAEPQRVSRDYRRGAS